jgi:hypothetical protein
MIPARKHLIGGGKSREAVREELQWQNRHSQQLLKLREFVANSILQKVEADAVGAKLRYMLPEPYS